MSRFIITCDTCRFLYQMLPCLPTASIKHIGVEKHCRSGSTAIIHAQQLLYLQISTKGTL